MLIYTPASAAKNIPVIDLSESFSSDLAAKKAVAWEVHKACRETGFFYISNHGIPQEFLDKQLECARAFFDLPMDQKMALDVANSASMRGYEPMSSQTLDDGSKPDLKEGFMAGVDGAQAYTTGGEYNSLNQWPNEFPEMRLQTESYISRMSELGKHLLGVLARACQMFCV